MKSFIKLILILILTFNVNAQVGIGTTTPNGALDIISTNNGLLIPRVALTSTTDLTTVITSTESELVYNTTPASGSTDVSPGFYYLSSPTGPWVRLGSSASSPPPPPPPPTSIGWATTGNADIIEGTSFLGTTNNVDIVFRRDDTESGRIGATNTSFGLSAGEDIAAGGIRNTTVGVEALKDNIIGDQNTSVGFGALRNTTATNNTAVGYNAGATNISGTGNTAIGSQSLRFISIAGNNNTAVGHSSGNTATGDNNTTIGFGADVPNDTVDNHVRIGNGSVTNASVQVAWTIGSDMRLKESIKESGLGLDFLQSLRPVSYVRKNDDKKRTEYGFIAQELEQAFNNAGDKNNAIISKTYGDIYGVRYNDFISITIKAVQEQQELIEALKIQNEALLEANAAIMKRLEVLENK